jgi:hypothetical protein
MTQDETALLIVSLGLLIAVVFNLMEVWGPM